MFFSGPRQAQSYLLYLRSYRHNLAKLEPDFAAVGPFHLVHTCAWGVIGLKSSGCHLTLTDTSAAKRWRRLATKS